MGGVVNVANKSAVFAINTNSSLTGTGVTAVAGTLLDNSGLAFTNAIKGSVVLSSTGVLQKTYQGGASVAGFGAGIGAGTTFTIQAGTAAGGGTQTLQASLVNGALDFKGTFTNAAVFSILNPAFSSIKNTIQWYNTNTASWQNIIAGNGQNGAVANVIKSGYQGFSGSFNAFLLSVEGMSLATLNSLSGSDINANLNKIMGAYGYDATTHTSWAVIDHNSLFAADGTTPNMSGLSINDNPISADLSVFTVQPVPEPGTWGLILLGCLAMSVVARHRQKTEDPSIS